ncbi:MAG: hypothetical protein IJC36_01680 [Clostridia bacterium]|nr:hypothetical protein [Clostridia bacterium]
MNELNLSNLLGILKKCIVYIILVGFLFAVGAYCYCKFIAVPTYQAKTSFIATNGGLNPDEEIVINTTSSTTSESSEAKILNTDYAASRNLLDTYVGLFNSRKLYVMVQEKLAEQNHNLDYTPEQLQSMVSVARRSDEQLFIDFTVTCVNKEHAVAIADTLYAVGDEFVSSFFSAGSIMAVDDSAGKAVQNYPRTFNTMIISAFLGGVLVFVLAIIINLLDKTIKGEKDFSANYDIPILGNIPNFKAAAREETK